MKTLANFIKEYPQNVHPIKKLNNIIKYAEFMESKPVYNPTHEFWKDFEERGKSDADGWVRLRHKKWVYIWWFPKKEAFESYEGIVFQSYEEIVRYILRN